MNSDSTAIRSYVNDAPLPDVAPWRHRMNRAVDLAAFAVVKHFLSRARHHAFDLERTRDFAERWRDASVEDFYRIESFPASRENSSKLERTLRNARGRIELTLDSPLRTEEDRNNRFWLEFHLGHPIDRAPMFVILHGWRSVSVRGYHKMCGELNEMGVNAAVMHLPYHFSRRPSGTFNGELAISADLVRTGNGLRHGVMEMRW
ncbi:MAG: hypothetical protein JO317_00610, partial [Verrucomicrobiae bacterium]|nr:hypothetical protein [Verrucomicrobiae bacterium]